MKHINTFESFLGEISERAFSSEERKKLADKGFALPDGSYPIGDEADLKNAIRALGRAKDTHKVALHIEARAKALGKENLIPTTDKFRAALKGK